MPPVTPADLVAAIRALPGGTTRWVGIDGFGGAGKSTLATRLARALDRDAVPVSDPVGAPVTVVHVDDFAGPGVTEWDWPRMRRELVDPLLAGRAARYQVWDWGADVGGPWVDVEPGGVVLVEGVSATRRELGLAWDLTVWVDAPAGVRRARALARDGTAQWPVWQQQWIPQEQKYAARERPRERVTFTVDGEGHWTVP